MLLLGFGIVGRLELLELESSNLKCNREGWQVILDNFKNM